MEGLGLNIWDYFSVDGVAAAGLQSQAQPFSEWLELEPIENVDLDIIPEMKMEVTMVENIDMDIIPEMKVEVKDSPEHHQDAAVALLSGSSSEKVSPPGERKPPVPGSSSSGASSTSSNAPLADNSGSSSGSDSSNIFCIVDGILHEIANCAGFQFPNDNDTDEVPTAGHTISNDILQEIPNDSGIATQHEDVGSEISAIVVKHCGFVQVPPAESTIDDNGFKTVLDAAPISTSSFVATSAATEDGNNGNAGVDQVDISKVKIVVKLGQEMLTSAIQAGIDPDKIKVDSKVNRPVLRRKEKQFVPDHLKDPEYLEKRLKNNGAAKKSRDARRVRENEMILRAVYLEDRYVKLQQRYREAIQAKAQRDKNRSAEHK